MVFKRKKTYYPLGIMNSREFHNSKEIDRRTTQDASSNSFSKDNESLSLNHKRKEGLSSLIQAMRTELLYRK